MLQILGWIILGVLWVLLCILSCNAMDNYYGKRYMLIISKEVHYFETCEDAINYIKISELGCIRSYQLYVRDKKKYTYISDCFDD